MTRVRGAADKPALRRAVLSRRAALPPDERARIARTAAEVLVPEAGPGPVAAYLSVGTEPGTAELLAALARAGVEVLLPVLLPDGDLDWARAGAGVQVGVQPGAQRLLEPTGPRLGPDAVRACTLIVVPALSVDRRGVRLGRGGGSYDRALRRSSGRSVALLHDGEAVAVLPAEPHDVPVHALVTPSRGLVALREHGRDDPTGGQA